MATSVKKNGKVNGANSDGTEEKVHFSKAGLAAIAFEADSRIHDGKLQMALIEKHIAAYRADKTYLDNAKAIHIAIREKVVEHWTKHPGHFGDKVNRAVPPVRDERVSEWRKAVRMGDWKCVDTVLDYFREDKMTFDDVLTVANYLIANVSKTSKAPKKEDFIAAIIERKAKKTGRFNEQGKLVVEKKKVRPLDIGKAITTTARIANGWAMFVAEELTAKKRAEAVALIKAIRENASKLQSLASEETAEA